MVKAQQQTKSNATQKEILNQKEMEGEYKYMYTSEYRYRWTMKILKSREGVLQ